MDKILIKLGELQSNLHEQIEQAKMSRGSFGSRAPKSEEESSTKTSKVDENDLVDKIKNMDLQTVLGFDKFKDSVNFDIRMLKDEYLEFKNKVMDKQNGLEDIEHKLKGITIRIDELADSQGSIKKEDPKRDPERDPDHKIDLSAVKSNINSNIHHSIVNS